MSIDRSEQSLKICIEAARVARRPLPTWPGDERRLTLGDLPEVSAEWHPDGEHPPREPVLDIVGGKQELIGELISLKAGPALGVIRREFQPGRGLVSIVGLWDSLT